jgi:hypothetical protein
MAAASAFIPPPKGSDEYEAWLDGPMPDASNGRGAWLGGRSARSRRTVVADGAEAGAAKAQSQAGSGFGQPATSVAPAPPADDATLTVLRAIRDDANAHDSDKIAASRAIIAIEAADAAQATGPSPLVALAHTLALLEPHERLAWLQGERIAHMRAQTEGEGGAA